MPFLRIYWICQDDAKDIFPSYAVESAKKGGEWDKYFPDPNKLQGMNDKNTLSVCDIKEETLSDRIISVVNNFHTAS